MELSLLSLMLLLIHCGQTQEQPTLTVDPQSSVYTGDTVTLSCEPPQGDGWEIYWRKNSQYLKHLDRLKTISVTESDPGEAEYDCVVMKDFQTVFHSDKVKITVRATPKTTVNIPVHTSSAATLTVSATPKTTVNTPVHTSAAATLTVSETPKATVNVQPAGHVFIRERVTLTCGIESGDDWNYEWYKNNNLLRDAQRKKYEISNVDQTHAGDYTCKGTQSTGRIYTHTSAAVTLTVSERPKATVNVQPAGHVFIRERVTLTCEIESGDDWNYEWYKNNNLLRDAQRKKYEISNVDQTHAGGDVILDIPVHPVSEGDSLTLRCLFRSTKPSNLTADFYKDGSLLQTQTTGEMIIRTVSKSDIGLYHCKHPERGESPQSWLSVRASQSGSIGVTLVVSVGLSLTLFLIIMPFLICCYKKNKAQASDAIYAEVMTTNNSKYTVYTDVTTTDDSENALYDEVMTTDYNEAVMRPNDMMGSQIKMSSFGH
ncbi:hypothetical protein SRHO_G00332980 [Serrasalmus rhombeus]